MYIKVGRYELNTSEEFKTEKEAVTRFLESFPDANPEKVKAKVKPYFKKDVRISEQVPQASSDSESKDAKADSGSAKGKPSGRDK